MKARLEKILIHTGLLVFAVWSLFPVVWVVTASFRPNLGALAGDHPFAFTPRTDNYLAVFQQSTFPHCFANTLIISVSATLLSLILGVPAGYGLARFRFLGRRFLSRWVLAVRLVPPIAFVVPFFIMFKTLQLLDARITLISIYTAFLLPFSIWLFNSFVREIPIESEEAALVDGCTRLGALFRVVLPRLWPAIGAASLLNLAAAWNEFLFALILTTSRAVTLPVAVTSFIGERGVLWGQITAAAVLTMSGPLIMTMLVNRYLLRGLTLGRTSDQGRSP